MHFFLTFIDEKIQIIDEMHSFYSLNIIKKASFLERKNAFLLTNQKIVILY